jgi:hypothetical protein
MTQFNKHLQAFQNNNCNSMSSQHLSEIQHPTDTIGSTMELLYTKGKGSHLDTVEKYCFYEETKNNNQHNDQNTVEPNVIFRVLSQQASQTTNSHCLSALSKPSASAITNKPFHHIYLIN